MNVTRPIASTEIETVIKTLPTNKSPVTDGFTGKVYQTLRKALAPTLETLPKKTTEEGTLPSSFNKPSSPRYQNQTKIPYLKITGQY